MNTAQYPCNDNIKLVCADCGCEIDRSPGVCAYMIDGKGFHHARPEDCNQTEPVQISKVWDDQASDQLARQQNEAVEACKRIAAEQDRKLGG